MSNSTQPTQQPPSDRWRERQPTNGPAAPVPRRTFLQRLSIGAGLLSSALVGFVATGSLRHPTTVAALSPPPTAAVPPATPAPVASATATAVPAIPTTAIQPTAGPVQQSVAVASPTP